MRTQEAFPDVVSNSFLEDVIKCPRKAQLRYGFGLSPVHTSVYLVAGGEFARAQEARRRAIIAGLPEEECILAGCMAIQSQKRPPPELMGNVPPSHTRGEVIMAFIFSCLKLPLVQEMETVKSLKGASVEAVEFSFLVQLPFDHPTTGDSLLMSGRLDGYEARGGMGLWGIDDKFVSRANSYGWEWSTQFISYGWAHQQYGLDLPGFVVKETTAEGITAQTIEHVVKRDPVREAQWYDNLQFTLEALLKRTHRGELWPTHYSKDSFGCKRCEMRTLCSNERFNPEDPTLPYGFKRIFWDPVTRTEREAT